MAAFDELFEQLLPCEWRSGGNGIQPVQFPIEHIRVTMRHDLAEHKYWGKDGAKVEATGRAPLMISATIPFRNGIVPGKSESWGVLYPTAFRAFLVATADRATGSLIHPELGEIRCKVESVTFDLTATKRDGVDVEVTWIETVDEDLDAVNLYDDSPIGMATIAATDLDAQLGELNPPPPEVPAFEPDFADFVRGIQGVGDQVSLARSRAAGKINSLFYRVDAVINSVANATSLSPGERSLRWTVRQSGERIKSALSASVDALAGDGRKVLLYTVPKNTTFAAISATLGANLSDMFRLNPTLLARPVVTKGTVVRYYDGASR